MKRLISRLLLIAASTSLLASTGCSSSDNDKKKADADIGTLSRSFDMIDKNDGRRYGTVEMDPVGGGRVIDSSGRVIGNIVPPSRY